MEMELQLQDHQEQKQHLCKLCNKSFSNGKVLGGHMRSHRTTTSTAKKNQPKNKLKKRKKTSIAASYSLRENPKKSWKFSAPISQNSQISPTHLQENHCKICGKGFDSSKALFGHMRHHSGRRKEPPVQKSKESLKSDGGGDTLGLLRRKRSRRTRCNPPYSSDLIEISSSSVNVDGIEPDVEELALCLLMLSKGVGNCRAPAEFSSESMGVGHFSGFEAKSPLNRATHLDFNTEDEVERVKLGFPEVGRFYAEVEMGMPKLDEDEESEMGFCEEEEKVRENGLKSLKKCEIGDFCMKDCEEEQEDRESMEKEGNHHQCDVCLKVFGTGQALGGHKRAHILKPTFMELDEEEEDENEDEDDDEFKPWWNGDDDNGGQQLVGSLFSSN